MELLSVHPSFDPGLPGHADLSMPKFSFRSSLAVQLAAAARCPVEFSSELRVKGFLCFRTLTKVLIRSDTPASLVLIPS